MASGETLDEEEKKASGEASPAKEEAEEAAAAAAAAEEEEEEVKTPTPATEKKRRGRKRKEEREEGEGEKGSTEKRSGRRRRSSSGATGEETPVERPSRERKAVERYSELSSPRRASASKILSIAQGSGTKLKEIPNVFYKISKRKADENLQALHTLLFGRKSNTHFLKRNIFQFSGFVWTENEEKQRTRIKEKLDKFNKDKLVDFCEMLDIPILKATTKKEEISAKLLEFLESPHVTRDIILAEKEEKRKRKRRIKGINQTSGETKKQGKSPETESNKRRKSSAKSEEEDEGDDGSADSKDVSTDQEEDDNSEEESGHAKSEEDEEDEPEEPVSSKKEPGAKEATLVASDKVSPIKKGSSAKSSKSPSKSVPKKASLAAEHDPETAVENKKGLTKKPAKRGSKATSEEQTKSAEKDPVKISKRELKGSPRKNVSVDDSDSSPPRTSKSEKSRRKSHSNDSPVVEAKKGSKKEASKSGSKVSIKRKGKGKATATANKGPSKDELHSVISNILKEVDFNTATLADIIKQLGAHFKMDLMDRKAEVKSIIEDVINSMSDAEDEEDEDDDAEDAGKEDAKDDSDGDDDE